MNILYDDLSQFYSHIARGTLEGCGSEHVYLFIMCPARN